MKTRRTSLIRPSRSILLRLAATGSLVVAAPFVAAAHDSSREQAPDQLVRIVRDATRQFINVDVATTFGYGPFLGCVNGPDHGAMGIHYVNHALFVDGQLDATKPEALIYEPSGGRLRLVGVEFLVLAEPWLASHGGAPPVLEGQVFNLVNSPNRFNLPAFFELHVWAWRNNPQGSFVDWNNHVTCEGQTSDPADPGGDN